MQYLGQHFLKNQRAVKVIIDALDLQPGETVIEIGPGRGALTRPLLAHCQKIGCSYVGIEKDAQLVSLLVGEFVSLENATILHGDALADLPKLTNQLTKQRTNYKVVGNIPYYITGALLRVLSELPQKPRLTVLMIQKEVAERLTAAQGKMNLLAAATQIWAEPKIIMQLSQKDFDPQPKVRSAVVRLTLHATRYPLPELEVYYRAIKIIFKQPRKTLLNNLVAGEVPREQAQELIRTIKGEARMRPQDLSMTQIREISTGCNIATASYRP